jgi:hypothetical protein
MMNDELIKEFARQAGFKVNWQHEDMQAIKMAQYKEFAELIVKECEKVSLQNSHRDDDMGAIIARQIKQHFGVRE